MSFEVGQLVPLHSRATKPGLSPKLSPKWVGPYRVSEKVSEINYWLGNLQSRKRVLVHVQRMTPYVTAEFTRESGRDTEVADEVSLDDTVVAEGSVQTSYRKEND